MSSPGLRDPTHSLSSSGVRLARHSLGYGAINVIPTESSLSGAQQWCAGGGADLFGADAGCGLDQDQTVGGDVDHG